MFGAAQILRALLLFLAITQGALLGQAEHDATTSARWMREAHFSFSLSRREDVKRFATVRDIAVLEATLVLEKFARQEYSNDDDEPKQAVKVLMMSGGSSSRALTALCTNILTVKSGRGDEVGPLIDFIAAQALIAIGGRPARTAIFDSLRQRLDGRELLIRAHVLAQMEPRSIMREHIRLALEDQEHRESVAAARIDENYKSNLRQMDEWLREPEFLANRNNWP